MPSSDKIAGCIFAVFAVLFGLIILASVFIELILIPLRNLK